eukprot:3387437-Amphidinium_carterae.2
MVWSNATNAGQNKAIVHGWDSLSLKHMQCCLKTSSVVLVDPSVGQYQSQTRRYLLTLVGHHASSQTRGHGARISSRCPLRCRPTQNPQIKVITTKSGVPTSSKHFTHTITSHIGTPTQSAWQRCLTISGAACNRRGRPVSIRDTSK